MPDISIVLDPSPDDVTRVIHDGLSAYNAQHAGVSEKTRFAVFVRDGHGTPVGGIEATLNRGWLHVQNFWLPESMRRQGIGSTMLREAESFARDRGCTASYLDTFEFQALPFYEKNGYEVFGIQEGYPAGFRRYYLQKALVESI